jgi:hypothetical protein
MGMERSWWKKILGTPEKNRAPEIAQRNVTRAPNFPDTLRPGEVIRQKNTTRTPRGTYSSRPESTIKPENITREPTLTNPPKPESVINPKNIFGVDRPIIEKMPPEEPVTGELPVTEVSEEDLVEAVQEDLQADQEIGEEMKKAA